MPPASSFIDYASGFLFGRTVEGINGKWNIGLDGKVTGQTPKMGFPDFIGGPLRKGQSALKIWTYLFNPKAFHSVKPGLLNVFNPKNYSHVVGRNPDFLLKGGKVWLTGVKNSRYYGKSYETTMTIADFMSIF